ncbi:hypothetical protein FACS1894105_02470 [Clostridia bacterium]|nr:hypothetical protein FACS1894105_02240 [Clostridia bacterium]GHU34873.1 hypothetical protein FACS1894105_02470 [Clostridia bacterium]
MSKSHLDLPSFWRDDELAHRDNCFSPDAPQVAFGIRMNDECVFSELGEEGSPWEPLPAKRRNELNKRYNDKAEAIVGIRLLWENRDETPPGKIVYPQVKRIGEIFGGHYGWSAEAGEWLYPGASDEAELEAILDKIERTDIRELILPDNWYSEKKRLYEETGWKPGIMRGIRGPVTLACSIYGIENLCYLFYDAPELFRRFSDAITKVTIGMGEVLDEEAGVKTGVDSKHFGFNDDNCCMLTAEMYEAFGLPILQKVFNRFCGEDGSRYQHSDSDMGHLLPVLAKAGLHGVNFGPTVLVEEIRKYMPNARIDGCIAPFTFMRNDRDTIIAEVRRDCEQIKAAGTKGLNLTTAGSINDGSSLESMRLIMETITEYGRY